MTASPDHAAEIRLLFVSDHLGHAGGTVHGATTYFLDVLPRLKQQGINLLPCFLGPSHPAASRLQSSGVSPLFLDHRKWDPRALGDLVQLIRNHRINLIHAAAMKGILLARAAGKRTGTPTLSHFHDEKPVTPVIAQLQRRTAHWSTGAIAISEAVAAFAIRELGVPENRMHVLYNGIDPSRARTTDPGCGDALREELGIAADAPVVTVIGRLSPEKGQSEFIATVPALIQRLPEARVLIVGDGIRRGHCEQLAASLGLTSSVHFLGFRDDLAAILNATNVVAIPSLSEGLSYTALEAMAARRPVVATAVGGIPEIVQDEKTGLLIEAGNHAAFPEAIARTLADTALRQTLIQGGTRLVDQLSIDAHVKALVRLYRQVLWPTEPTSL